MNDTLTDNIAHIYVENDIRATVSAVEVRQVATYVSFVPPRVPLSRC